MRQIGNEYEEENDKLDVGRVDDGVFCGGGVCGAEGKRMFWI